MIPGSPSVAFWDEPALATVASAFVQIDLSLAVMAPRAPAGQVLPDGRSDCLQPAEKSTRGREPPGRMTQVHVTIQFLTSALVLCLRRRRL